MARLSEQEGVRQRRLSEQFCAKLKAHGVLRFPRDGVRFRGSKLLSKSRGLRPGVGVPYGEKKRQAEKVLVDRRQLSAGSSGAG